MVDNTNSASNILAQSLKDPNYVKTAVITSNGDNTKIDDLKTMTYGQLVVKYGIDVANNRGSIQKEIEDQYTTQNSERTIPQIVGDTAVGAASGFVGMIGSGVAAVEGLAGAGLKAVGVESVGNVLSNASVNASKAVSDTNNYFSNLQSNELQKRKELMGIKQSINSQKSEIKYQQDIEKGDNSFIAGLKQFGRGAIDTGELLLEDGPVAGDIIAQAIGSLGPSAKLASVGVNLAERGVAKVTANATAKKIATVAGSSAGIGVAEVSGTYVDAVNNIMSRTPEEMKNSSEYNNLIKQGIPHEEAKKIIANQVATEASLKQLPTAAITGLIASKFNANPIKTFKGTSFIRGLKEIGTQTLEEGFQNTSSTFYQNLAIRNQVDPNQNLSSGLGEQFTTGAFGGFGMAGAIATPNFALNAAKSSVKPATEGIKAGTELYNNIAKPVFKTAVKSTVKGGIKATDIIAPKVSKTFSKIKPVTDPIINITKTGIRKVSDKVTPITENIINKSNKDLQNKSLIAVKEASIASDIFISSEQKTPKAVSVIAEDYSNKDVPKEFSHKVKERSTPLQTISGIVETLSDPNIKISKLSDNALLFISETTQSLKANINDLPVTIKKHVNKILSSPDLMKVNEVVSKIDLNDKFDNNTDINSDVIQTSISMSKQNPSNVNPNINDKILKHEDKNISSENIKLLKAASKIARLVNGHQGEQVKIIKEENIGLTREPSKSNREIKNKVEATSRSVQVEGFVNKSGKKLPSINDFASYIFEGGLSENSVVNVNNINVPVKSVIKQFSLLVKHLDNKIKALNTSLLNRDPETGVGIPVAFKGLVSNGHLIKGAGASVAYHSHSANSIALAKAVHNDAKTAVEVYNTLVDTFPELFEFGKLKISDLLPSDTPPLSDESSKQFEQSKKIKSDVKLDNNVSKGVSEKPIDSKDILPPKTVNSSPEAFINNSSDSKEISKKSKLYTIFEPINKIISYSNGAGVLYLIGKDIGGEAGVEYQKLAKNVILPLFKSMNNRLLEQTVSKKDKRSISKAIMDGEELYKYSKFKNTVLVDPKTGRYDPDLLSTALVVIFDWITDTYSANPSLLENKLEDLGLDSADLTSKELYNIAFGLSPRQVAEDLSVKILKMWNVKEKKSSTIVDSRGVAEGIVKEIFIVLDQTTDLLSVEKIPVIKNNKKTYTPTLLVNGFKGIQDNINVKHRGYLKKLFFPKETIAPSFGEKIIILPKYYTRSKIPLSNTEKSAVKTMQDTPHYLFKPFYDFVNIVGFDVLSKKFGYKNIDNIADKHTIYRSIFGKNISIERNWSDTMLLADELSLNPDTPIYYPIGVSQVGRHPMKGINPQNNKLLRSMITPNISTLDMNTVKDRNNFWLTVLQSSDLVKLEKQDIKKLLLGNTIEIMFMETFGKAVSLVEEYLDTGAFSKKEFESSLAHLKELDERQLSAIFAVASLRTTEDVSKFKTNLFFEFDGVNDGPGNMMIHFGYGKITPNENENFKRIGLYLGNSNTSLNDYFSKNNSNTDLYEQIAEDVLNLLLNKDLSTTQHPDVQKQINALVRFSTIFGGFDLRDDGKIGFNRSVVKGPVTQFVYGSGSSSISKKITKSMIMNFYSEIIKHPMDNNLERALHYPGLIEDFKILFNVDILKVDWKNSSLNNQTITRFESIVDANIGVPITNSVSNIMGDKVATIKELLLKTSSIQSEFLQKLFKQKLNELVELRASEGKISRHKTTKKGFVGHLTNEDYDSLIKDLYKFAIKYSNGIQTLSITDFKKSILNGIKLSSDMDETFRASSTLLTPNEAGVKSLPFITIGRGDAMMMNYIYSSTEKPNDTLPIFDAITVPINRMEHYSNFVNSMVMKGWEQDVMGNIKDSFNVFMELAYEENPVLIENVIKQSNKKKTIIDYKSILGNIHKEYLSRKETISEIPVSVDHLAGAGIAYSRIDKNNNEILSLEDINSIIDDKTNNKKSSKSPKVKENKENKEPIVETTVKDILSLLRKEIKYNNIRSTVHILLKLINKDIKDFKVILNDPSINNRGEINFNTKTIHIKDSNYETIVHELIHLMTFKTIEQYYKDKTSLDENKIDAIKRLEVLMENFINSDFSNLDEDSKDSLNSALGQILFYQSDDTSFNKAASLNEFMAWTLSNENIIKILQKKENKLISKIKVLARRILGHVPKNMYDNILFNSVIVAGFKEGNSDNNNNNDNNNNDGGNGSDGSGEGLTPYGKSFTNFWVNLVKERIEKLNEDKKTNIKDMGIFLNYQKKAKKVIDELIHNGFNFSHEEKQTFEAIHIVLATELTLEANASVAIHKVFAHVIENLTPEMFGEGKQAQEKYLTIRSLMGASKNIHGVDDSIAVFLALSQTNKVFRDAISQVKPLKVDKSLAKDTTDSLNKFLGSVTSILINRVLGVLDTTNQPIPEILNNLAETLIIQESDKEFRGLRTLMNSISNADLLINKGFIKAADVTDRVSKKIREEDHSRLVKNISETVNLVTSLLDETRSKIAIEGVKDTLYRTSALNKFTGFKEFINEIVGTDSINRNVVSLLDDVHHAVTSVRQEYRESLPVILNNLFKTTPTDVELKLMYNVLAKGDFAVIFSVNNPDKSFKYFSDSNLVSSEINTIEQILYKNYSKKASNKIINKSKQLASYLRGDGAGIDLQKNSYSINKLSKEYNENFNVEIDKLVSLYFIERISKKDKDNIVELYKNNSKAVGTIIAYIQVLNAKENIKEISDIARMNGYKGFIPNNGKNPNTHIIISEDENEESLLKRGYIRVSDYVDSHNIFTTSFGYYVTSTKQSGAYTQGVMQSVQDTYRGVDSHTGLSITNDTSGLIVDPILIERITKKINKTKNPDLKNTFIPVYSEDGSEIIAYEQAINPDMINKFIEPVSNITDMVGNWAGRQEEEKGGQIYNESLIKYLKNIYDKRENNSDALFINVKAEADYAKIYNKMSKAKQKKSRKPDFIVADSWSVIPPQTKMYIESIFGKGNFMVRKDMINLSIGYREASIVDLWSGKTRLPSPLGTAMKTVLTLLFKEDAMKFAGKTETSVQSTISGAKDAIIIRSMVVPYMNTQANVFQLWNRDVPIKTIINGYKQKFVEIDQYNENRKKIIKLNVRIALNRKNKNTLSVLNQQKAAIESQNKRLSIYPLIVAGAYKNISEGMTEEDAKLLNRGLYQWLDSKADSLTNSKLKAIAKYGLLSKDTALYRGADKAVQYGDFLAKSILYDHLIKNENVSKEDALSNINEEFVNFSVPVGRSRSYSESVGAFWFMAFKIRSMKIAMSMMRKNPIRSLIISNTVGDFGSPVHDNLVPVINSGRLDYAMGWDMLFGVPDLNPWVAMMELN